MNDSRIKARVALVTGGSGGIEKGTASPPSVIADTILQAIKARRPKSRYAAGVGVRQAIFFRRILSDRLSDRFMMRMFG